MPDKKSPARAAKKSSTKPAPTALADADQDDPVTRAGRRLDRIARAIKAGAGYGFPADEDDEDITFD